MKVFPKLKTERLVLKKLRKKDIPLIVKYAGDKEVSKFTLNMPFPYLEKDAIWWINFAETCFEEKSRYVFGIFLKNTDEFIGGISIEGQNVHQLADLGYWITKKYWNKGFMTEALNKIIEFGFKDLKLNKIYAQHLLENISSGIVMQKVGMVKEAEMLDHNFSKGNFRSVAQYRILKREYDLLKIANK